jgi:aspartyl-tRNA(Asn)/glutamyl-tRNA(Gln) amidotransferase subunit A
MGAESQTIAELSPALQQRRVTAQALTERCLQRIADRNTAINAYITVLADDARAQAAEADEEIAAGRYRGPLHGIPVSLKDLIDVRGVTTTAASRVRAGHVAARDASVTARLRGAGAILLGKTNLHEFAFGTTNEESAFGPVLHPLDANRSPGGSSGGSAASVLDDMAFASVGTDTGGSVRIPAAACGLVGLKPGLGEIPTDGIVPLSATLDHVGPLCRSVADAAIVYDVLRGASDARPLRAREMRGLRLGVPREYFLAVLDSQVSAAFESACRRLADAGVVLDDVTIPHTGDIAPVYLHIVLAEAAAFHAKTLESRPDSYTPNVRIRLEMGRYVMAEDYVRAMRGREVLMQEVDAAMGGRDGLLLPALAVPATRLGVQTIKVGGVDEPVRNVTLRLTQLFNVTGHPAITVPCGRTIEGLPIGAQLVGRRDATSELLRVAAGAEPYLGPGTSR